ncbi:MAG TPA: type I methionyl aminopeptidase [Saprospiraceae bacterium]|nr:type I methionyl aminopeptidase [Saprospiraceae bacterium]
MIYYKTEEEVELIRESCLMVCKTLAYAGSLLKPGITGAEIDAKAEEFIRDNGGIPGFKGYGGFPGTLCISVNEQVVHGIPSDKEFKDGDIISLDCGVIMNDYNGDAAYTFALGDVKEETMKLLRVTKESLYRGIGQAVKGRRIGDIGYAIQDFAEKQEGYGIVRELVGHGIGKALHEDPEVPNFGRRGRGILLKENLVIAIEPMVNLKTKQVVQENDGWTIRTKDRQPSAHYEHTVVVRKNQAEILSDHSFIEEMIKTNKELKQV